MPLVVGCQPRPSPLTVLNMPTNGPANMNHYPLLIAFVRGTRISREPEVVSRLLFSCC